WITPKYGRKRSDGRQLSGLDGLDRLTWNPTRYIPRHRAGRDGIRRAEVELTRAGPAREVPVLGGDRHVVRRAGHPRARRNARTAPRLDELGAHTLEKLQVAPAPAVLPHLDGAALDEELHVRVHPAPLAIRLCQNARVHVHVFLLARGTRARVRDVDPDALGAQVVDEDA